MELNSGEVLFGNGVKINGMPLDFTVPKLACGWNTVIQLTVAHLTCLSAHCMYSMGVLRMKK